MRRLNFTLDDDTIALLDELSGAFYGGNKSQTVRAALESLAAHTGHDGWVIAGYAPMELAGDAECHSCHTEHAVGEVLYRPVFERGRGPNALQKIPAESWLDCPDCVEKLMTTRA